MPRITLKDGRWLDMRLPTIDEYLGIMDLPEADNREAQTERLRFFRETYSTATRETSWGGSVGDLTIPELTEVLPQWLFAVEDDAVPPESGSSSGTPPLEQRSRAQTAKRRRRGSRRST